MRTLRKLLIYYFLISTVFSIFVAYTGDAILLLPASILAGASFFGYILLVNQKP